MLGTQDIPRYTGQRVLKDSDIMVSVAEFVTDATSLLHLLAFGEAEGHIPEHWHLPRLINVLMETMPLRLVQRSKITSR